MQRKRLFIKTQAIMVPGPYTKRGAIHKSKDVNVTSLQSDYTLNLKILEISLCEK
jgi:hypothetical protein